MDKEQIKHIALQMESREDLLNLLNRIKRDEMEELGLADKFHPFTIKHMNYYCNPKNAFHRYRQFKIKKKSGGFRQITAPRNRSYMFLLDCLNEVFIHHLNMQRDLQKDVLSSLMPVNIKGQTMSSV